MKSLRVILSLAFCVAIVCCVLADDANLLPNGDLEKADAKDSSKPLNWDRPDGRGVQWVDSGDKSHGKAIRMDTAITEKAFVEQCKKVGLEKWAFPNPAGNAIAETYGLSLYSDAIALQKGQAYRVSFDFKGKGGGGKLWVRCYGERESEKVRMYETVVTCEGKTNEWKHFSQVFFPTKFRPAVTEMRVMLFAYYPPGVYWFDNITIEPVSEEVYGREKQGARK